MDCGMPLILRQLRIDVGSAPYRGGVGILHKVGGLFQVMEEGGA